MKFETSAEVSVRAHPALVKCQRSVDPFLKAKFAVSSLAALDCTLRYVPIIMAEEMKANYPERSKIHRKERVYDCAPVLDYDVFVAGDSEEQFHEYLRGITLAAPHLGDLGDSDDQVKEFRDILAKTAQQLLANRH